MNWLIPGLMTLALFSSCSVPRPYTGGSAGHAGPGTGTAGMSAVGNGGTGGAITPEPNNSGGRGGTVASDPMNGNNCNGLPDEGCPCVNGATQDCGHATIGACHAGKSTCQNSTWGHCVGNVEPTSRDCTSSDDNDCDGKADNTIDDACQCAMGSFQSCGAHPGKDGNGPCKAGTQSCVVATNKASSDWGACTGAVGPAAIDTCEDGNDDNCDGLQNEGCPCVNGATQDCGHAAVGICKTGKATCQNSTWGACVGNVEPAPRDCTSPLDNDCNGKPDNTIDTDCKCAMGSSQSCGAHPGNDGNGPCKSGIQTCVVAANKATSDWGTCAGAVGPAAADTCDPNNDNNCNGSLNDGCTCVNGQPVACACGVATTCTNGIKGTCAVNKTTLFVDADGDGYGKGPGSQQCPGTSMYSTNANDCDDNNAGFKPNVSICPDAVTLKICPATGGSATTQSCTQGCYDGQCRTDGTIGLPGYVTCLTPPGTACSTSVGCNWNAAGCGSFSSPGRILCDGPNDCGANQVCCIRGVPGAADAACFDSSCPGSYQQVCDPLVGSCSCQRWSSDNALIIYVCQ